MTFTGRVYVYAMNDDGSKEFLHTFLTLADAKKYCKEHYKIFKGRYESYIVGSHSDNIWEVV